ncbi:succinyl-diaminopimelate desuccinylase [Thalassospiraceae bacterium LMO-SO8]|nr:succinyl-diaminopimelate desuccinylase [Alphaproteobacteria bacterium LMO-S08]WND77273.1 succinyl-diaminopimelate desuccinylase [Thalassospiraceae bacterium LMO-SO8]
MSSTDVIELSEALIRCPSVTPAEGGALDLLQTRLEALGFTCHRLPFTQDGTPDVDNLYARIGTDAPNFCFAGHTDVVPPGDAAGWASDPFKPEIRDGRLYGRGASDMKCAIAAMVAGTDAFLKSNGYPQGSISFLITGDEEGPSVNGTKKVLGWLAERGEKIDACLVGEPTNVKTLGDMVKIGRRGSLNCTITVTGTQGHVAYPHLADNPVPKLLKMLSALNDEPLDHGNDHFPATNLEITTVDVGNATTNLIPAQASARINIRFNDMHSGASLTKLIEDRCAAVMAGETKGSYDLDISVSGESFLTPPGQLSGVVAGAVQAVTGQDPELSTTGGTSDARFIKDHCPVVEFGLINETAHKMNENALVTEVRDLARIYQEVLKRFFAQ